MPKNNSQNPLVLYKKANKLRWMEISERTGIVRQVLYGLSQKTPEAFQTVSLSTALRLRRGLHLDILDWLDHTLPKSHS
jgi:hypothetical protein